MAREPNESEIAVAAVASDASSAFAVSVAPHQAPKLIWLQGADRQRRTVFTAPGGAGIGQVGFDGRWLIFEVSTATDVGGAWDLYAWDSRSTTAPHLVAHDDGKAPQEPFFLPKIRDGRATWTQGLADGTRQVHLYDLAAAKDEVVATGHMAPSFFAGDLVVWPEQASQNAAVNLKALVASTGQPAVLPAPMASVSATGWVVSDGTTWVWTADDYRILTVWRAGWSRPKTILTYGDDNYFNSINIANDLVSWSGVDATYVADLRSASYVQVTPQNGTSMGNGNGFAVSYPEGNPKDPGTNSVDRVVKERDLPALPGCS